MGKDNSMVNLVISSILFKHKNLDYNLSFYSLFSTKSCMDNGEFLKQLSLLLARCKQLLKQYCTPSIVTAPSVKSVEEALQFLYLNDEGSNQSL
jgi:hypothetical protein